jgi:Na+/melibiose symporter-like transporter
VSGKDEREFTWLEGFAFCLAWIGIQLCSELLNQYGAYFYSPPEGGGRIVYVSIQLVGVMFFLGAVCEGVTNPIVGLLSDRTLRCHAGRGCGCRGVGGRGSSGAAC